MEKEVKIRPDIYKYRLGDYRNILVDEYIDKFPFLIEQVGTDHCQKEYRMNRENSSLSVIGYTIQGEGRIVEDGKKFTVHKNEFFIVRNGHSHTYYPKKDWAYKWINIYGDFDSVLKAYGLENVTIFYCPPMAKPFMETIEKCLSSNDGIEKAQIDGISFICYMLPYIKLSTIRNFGVELEIEEKIKAALENVCFTNYSFDDICKSFGINKRHAQRLFKNKYNMTPHGYVLQLRYKQACSLLMMPNLSIKQISSAVGFEDCKYFSTFFKSYGGFSPTMYRNLVKK